MRKRRSPENSDIGAGTMPVRVSWRSVASAVAAALSVPPSQWSQVLAAALDGDRSRIARARELLRHQSAVGGFMEDLSVPKPDDPPALSSGLQLGGRYEIGQRLGSGAMGEVYEAYDLEVRQKVALKVINPRFSPDGSSRDRFRRELKLGRQVRQRNVCQLFDVVSTQLPGGTPFLVLTMELLSGQTLEQVLVAGTTFTEPEIRTIAAGLLDGLEAAHAQGILHGDLKCSNVVLQDAPEGSATSPVITDFGLARRLTPSPFDSLYVEDPNIIMGTPAYMAPEQILGKPLMPAADIHALGVMLFRMATGRLPFAGRTAVEVMAHRLHDSAPAVGRFAKGFSRAFERTVHACLESDAARRPQSAQQVRQLLAGTWQGVRRRTWVAVAALTVLLTVFAGRYVLPVAAKHDPDVVAHLKLGEEFLARRGASDFQQAIDEFQRAVALDPGSTDGWTGLADAYSAAANWGVMDNAAALRSARDAINRAHALAPQSARVQALLGYITSIDVQQWTTAEPYFRRALQLEPADDKAQFWFATHLGRLGRQSEAIALLNKVLSVTPQSFSVQHQLAMEYYRAGRHEEFLTRALQLVRIQPNLPNSHLTLARAYVETGRLDDAALECGEAEKFGADRSQLLAVVAVLQHERGQLADAAASRDELERLWRERPVNSNGVAAAFGMAGDAAKAVTYLNAGFDQGDSLVLAAHVTPWFDRIKNDDGFKAFVRRTGLAR